MSRNEVKEILERVLSWPAEDQRMLVRFVDEMEQRHASDDITDEEWRVIKARAARRDLATDDEVEHVFRRYRLSAAHALMRAALRISPPISARRERSAKWSRGPQEGFMTAHLTQSRSRGGTR
jgi:hypothetical protein